MESSGELPAHLLTSSENNRTSSDKASKGAGRLAKTLIVAKLGLKLLNAGDDIAAIGVKAFIPDNQNAGQVAQIMPPSYTSELTRIQTSGAGSNPPVENAQPQIIHDASGNPIAKIPQH